MKLIVGLGNPGKIYQDSRHNIGFSVVKTLAKFYKISFRKESGTFSITAKGKINNQNVILAIPFTFMNMSGVAVGSLIKKYKIDLENLLVVYDDLDVEFSRFKIQPAGSFGGHRGLKSIIYSLGSQQFSRLRIGIGRPLVNIDAAEYVLSPFSKREMEKVKDVIIKASDCCRVWVTNGVVATMNIFNKKSENNDPSGASWGHPAREKESKDE